jgi:AmmeMemoRadiSam system protein A
MLTQALKRELLEIARNSIAATLQDKPPHRADASEHSPELLQPGGAFVTLRIGGELRGCIGYMESLLPIAEVVAEVAMKAAVDDPRFPPLTLAELEKTSVEISIISPPHLIQNKDEVIIGSHGLMLELGFNKGVLLPQVAVEYGWSVEEFLGAVCRKAGLPLFAWRDPAAAISVFTADVFDEEAANIHHVR